MNKFLFHFLFWQNQPPVPAVGWWDILSMLFTTAIALGIVCGLAILIFRYILPRLNVVQFNKSIVNVIDGTSLDARKRLFIVEVAGKYMLLASSEEGVRLISELDGAAVEKAVADMAQASENGKKDLFTQAIDKVWQKRK